MHRFMCVPDFLALIWIIWITAVFFSEFCRKGTQHFLAALNQADMRMHRL